MFDLKPAAKYVWEIVLAPFPLSLKEKPSYLLRNLTVTTFVSFIFLVKTLITCSKQLSLSFTEVEVWMNSHTPERDVVKYFKTMIHANIFQIFVTCHVLLHKAFVRKQHLTLSSWPPNNWDKKYILIICDINVFICFKAKEMMSHLLSLVNKRRYPFLAQNLLTCCTLNYFLTIYVC